jgi:hypothetical protein
MGRRATMLMLNLLCRCTMIAELENIYEPTKATAEGAKTITMLHELLEKYQHCSGADCP